MVKKYLHRLLIFSDLDEILRLQNSVIIIAADGMAGIGDIYAFPLWILYPALLALILILAFRRIRRRYCLPFHELESQPETLPFDIKATVGSAVVAVDTSNSTQASLSVSGTIPSASDPLRSQSYRPLRWPSSIPTSGYLASSRLKAQTLENTYDPQPDAQTQLESTADISSENWKIYGPSIPAPEAVPSCQDDSERGSSICAPLPGKESLGDSQRHSSAFLTESTVVPSSSSHQKTSPSQESCSKVPDTIQKRSDTVQLFRRMDGNDNKTWRRRVIEYH
ncbi:hypothetical protein V8E54_004592 [Elaphomyces granulatus]